MAPRPLMVNPGLTARTVGGLIEPVRLRPDEVNFGSAGPGAASHAGAELFQSLARTRMVRVPCNQPGVALNDLISGQISWHCTIWRSRCRM